MAESETGIGFLVVGGEGLRSSSCREPVVVVMVLRLVVEEDRDGGDESEGGVSGSESGFGHGLLLGGCCKAVFLFQPRRVT